MTQTRRNIQSIEITINYRDDVINRISKQLNVLMDVKKSMNIERREMKYIKSKQMKLLKLKNIT